ncbi:Adenylate cyclase, class 3 [Treponema bryantii]|uniref:Adenylate cyclase, class 3 n=1 Tax=Treponema bryantii TaxID=163 RepID=A0A1H9DG05_9SPIR|nr:adenylate/guanylate cyclase domain-containing protein [Treponema bryantii]SEQ12404.1 Adenylate cyclase, class 3 [Treponema bryantii]
MSNTIRIISIVVLSGLAFFCLQVGVFLLSGHRLKNNSRRTLILLQFITGALLAFDAMAYIFRGTSQVGYYMVRISNFMVFALNYFTTFFFCFYSAEFIKSDVLDFKVLFKPRSSIRNGVPVQLYIVFYICVTGIILTIVSQFTNLFYYFDDANLYHRSALYPVSIVLGLSPGLITWAMLFQSQKILQKNVLISLAIYPLFPIIGIVLALLVYGISWIDIGYGIGALHLFFSSIKLMELEFYSDKKDGPRLSPNYKQGVTVPEMKRHITRSHVWQVIAAVSGGLLLVMIIVSITGISIPERKLVINKPYLANDKSKSVCVTFLRDSEKFWNDDGDLTRLGAQYNGVIYNNMMATVITDWNVTIDVCEDCTIDPGPWNGNFTITDRLMNVRKPQDKDEENLHGADYYQVTPLKNLGFGCIMYSPAEYSPLDSKIIFTYESVLKPLSYFLFQVGLVVISILFIVSLTISFTEGKIIRVEEENRKLEDTVKERTKELQEEKNRSEELLLNILPEEVAKRLAMDRNAKIADKIENASVLFADIVGFTKITSTLDADTIVGALNSLYSRIDERAKREGIEKIKTIGDSYMAAAGLFGNEPAEKNALAIVNFARGMLQDIENFNATSNVKLFMRIGINSGNLIAGVIGKTKFVYDIWGDTVNVASRMESSGETSKIHVSENTMALLKGAVSASAPVEMEIKGKGVMKTYFL